MTSGKTWEKDIKLSLVLQDCVNFVYAVILLRKPSIEKRLTNRLVLFTRYEREVVVKTTANKSSSCGKIHVGNLNTVLLHRLLPLMLGFCVKQRDFRKGKEKDYN